MDLVVSFLETLVFGLLSWRLNQCGVQERFSDIVIPKYLAEGTDLRTVP